MAEIPYSEQRRVTGPIIQSLIAADRRLSPYVTYRHEGGFRLQLPEPIEDWLPSGDLFTMDVDYAALEMRIAASLGLTEEQLQNVEPNRLASAAVRRDTAMRDNFATIYGQLPPPAHVIADEAVEPGVVLAVPVAAGLRRAMQRTSPTGRRTAPVIQRVPSPDTRMAERPVAYHDQAFTDADMSLVAGVGKHWIDGKATGTMKLQVLKSRGDPPPPPPTAWDRIMADEDAF